MRLLEKIGPGARAGNVAGICEELIGRSESAAVDPEALWELARKAGYRAEICWSSGMAIKNVDVLFDREGARGNEAAMAEITFRGEIGRERNYGKYANQPNWSEIAGGWVEELKNHLREKLPPYMVPAVIVELEGLPLTANGKVDRKALPEPVVEKMEAGEEGRTPVEEIVAGIWSEVLKLERVGVKANFFELGGHSLAATRVVSRVRELLGAEVALRAIFETPTVEGLAQTVERARGLEVERSPIERVLGETATPLSYAQQRLWFIDRLEPGSPVYNMSSAVELRGWVNAQALRQTISEIVRRHEALRTSFPTVNGGPAQRIAEAEPLPLPIIDLRGLNLDAGRHTGERLSNEEAARPFDLSTGPLLRTALILQGTDRRLALQTMHHIISDAWSMGVLTSEVGRLYQAYSEGRPSPLEELLVQYADYARWQRGWFEGERLERQLSYWKEKLKGAPHALKLPTDRPRPPVKTYRGARRTLRLSEDLSRRLKEISRGRGATLFMTLLAAFKVLLARHSGQEDLLVGVPIAGRTHKEVEGLIGFFVNTLVMRGDLSEGPGFGEFLEQVRETALGAYTHQDLPFEKLVEDLQPERDRSHSPLFQVTFQLLNTPPAGLLQQSPNSSPGTQRHGLHLEQVGRGNGTALFDLSLTVIENKQGLYGGVVYDLDLFENETVGRLLRRFESLLVGIAADPDRSVWELPLLSDTERNQFLIGFNDTKTDYPSESSVHQLFEAWADSTPDSVALIFDLDRHLSYGTLNTRANQLARFLIGSGVEPESRVGVMIGRSPEMVIALLGVLKAGAAYLPLDPSYPAERLAYMLEDSSVSLLLFQERLQDVLPEQRCEELSLDAQWERISAEPGSNPAVPVSPDNLAYVIYTSGSSGTPKGVCVPHRGVVRLVSRQSYARFSAEEVFLQLAPISFDASTFEIWGSLLHGGRLVLAPDGRASLEEIAKAIEDHQVTTLWLTAGLFHEMADRQLGALCRLRRLLAGGDRLEASRARRVLERKGGCELINGYGPTENTTFTTCHRMKGGTEVGESVPIGRPIGNTSVYILGARMEPVGVGVSGEIYTGGEGLARGYAGRPEMTAGKFVPDPFGGEEGKRLYRTGDLGRYREGGEIEFLGRVDRQVKIRGYRIEPGEIEEVMKRHPSVKEAVVEAREDEPGEKRLVAYVVSTMDRQEDEELGGAWITELKRYLREKLPEYMAPAAIMELEKLPLTANGKVDRKTLPAPMVNGAAGKVEEARTPIEEILAGIWAEVLRLDRVGVNQDFFELGGHSLLATQVVSRIGEALGAEVELRAIFESPTVAGLAKAVEMARGLGAGRSPIGQATRQGDAPLSYAQRRLWFINQLDLDSSAYNIPSAVKLNGELKTPALEQSLGEVVRRHEALRTSFLIQGHEPVQRIAEAAPMPLPIIDLSGLEPNVCRRTLQQLGKESSRRPFNLATGPLLRVELLRLNDESHIVLQTMHHIVSDGWSMRVLTGEVKCLYGAYALGESSPLEELSAQYADYAYWQRQWLQGETLERQLSYWKGKLAGMPRALNLPIDQPRPGGRGDHGAHSVRMISESLSGEIKALSRREGSTLFMTLLAAFNALLHCYSGQEDLVVGTPIANRVRREIEPLIGFFVNMLVIRANLSGNPGFRDLLSQARETCLEAYANQDIPFEHLVQELQPDRSLTQSPLFQVSFALQNAPESAPEDRPENRRRSTGLTLSSSAVGPEWSPFDLVTQIWERNNALVVTLLYKTRLFAAATIENILEDYETLLQNVVSRPDIKLDELYRIFVETRERRSMIEKKEIREASMRKFIGRIRKPVLPL
jgi:amino acid adenylation domain-containing protein